MLKKLFKWLIGFFKKKESNISKNEFYNFEFVNDVPDYPANKTLYIVGDDGYFWQFVVICPCGCKSLLYMNLMDDQHPFWKYSINNGLISITPSIHRKVGCESHFFIRESEIVWA